MAQCVVCGRPAVAEVTISEDGTLQITFLNRHAPGEMHFLDQAVRQGVQESVGIEAMVVRIQKEIFEIEQESRSGLGADQVEKFGIGHFRIRPFEQVGYVLEQERNGDARLDRSNLGDDLLGNRRGLRQWQEVAQTTTGDRLAFTLPSRAPAASSTSPSPHRARISSASGTSRARASCNVIAVGLSRMAASTAAAFSGERLTASLLGRPRPCPGACA